MYRDNIPTHCNIFTIALHVANKNINRIFQFEFIYGKVAERVRSTEANFGAISNQVRYIALLKMKCMIYYIELFQQTTSFVSSAGSMTNKLDSHNLLESKPLSPLLEGNVFKRVVFSVDATRKLLFLELNDMML